MIHVLRVTRSLKSKGFIDYSLINVYLVNKIKNRKGVPVWSKFNLILSTTLRGFDGVQNPTTYVVMECVDATFDVIPLI